MPAEQRGRDFILWGSKGHALVLADIIALAGGRVVALVDNDPDAVSVLAGVPLHIGEAGLRQALARHDASALCGLAAIGGGRGRDREDIRRLFLSLGLRTPALIHPRAHVAESANIEAATHVMAGAVVASGARIGADCIVNHGAIVEHETVLDAGCHVGPGATLCGCVSAGRYAFIGAGSVVLPRLRLGEGCVVGAGSVVTRPVAAGAVVRGNPAREAPSRKD